jgi:hypothetical protein
VSSDRLALCLALALGAGCDTCPPDYHVIRAMRVLGTTFDPPVAPPGGAVTVRTLTADVEARDVTVAWYRCPANLTLTPTASVDGEFDPSSVVAPCLAQGAFANGPGVRVPIDAEGGALDALPYRTRRRWTDLVAFACADGTIEPPPTGGLWPRCTGTRGVLFTVSIPGPTADGDATPPRPAAITDLTFADRGAWRDDLVPSVPRCEGSRETCRAVQIRFRVPDARLVTEPTAVGNGILGAPSDDYVFVGYHVTGAAPASKAFCENPDTAARISTEGTAATLAWVPPAEAGEVTFWFTARRYSGGLTVARRTARVE